MPPLSTVGDRGSVIVGIIMPPLPTVGDRGSVIVGIIMPPLPTVGDRGKVPSVIMSYVTHSWYHNAPTVNRR